MSRLRFFSVVFAALLLGVVCARPYASHRGSTSISRGDAHWRKLLDDGDSSSDSADTNGGLTGFNSQNLISDVVGSIGSDDDSSAPADASTNEAEEPTETEVDDNAAGSSSQEDNSAEATTETVEDNGTAEDANAEEKPAAAEDTESSTDDSDASEVPKDNSTDGSPEPTALFTSVAPSYTLPVVLNVTINIVYVQEIVKPKPEPKTVVVVIQAGDVGSAAAALAKLIDDGYGTAGGEAYAQAVKYFADEGDTTNTFNLLMATAAGTNQAITDGNDKEANKAANAFSKTLANLYGGGDSLTVVFNSFLSVALTLLQPVQGKTTTIIIYV